MPANQIAEQYLHTFAVGGDFPGGLAFRKALGQARLDFTPESLGRLDRLLRQMRQQLRPQYADFLEQQEHQNFLYLLCFYVGAVVYRYTREDFAWYAYDEMKEVAPPELLARFPEAFATSMVCMLRESGIFLPLSPILDVLFDEGDEASVAASADKYMRRLAGVARIARQGAPAALRDDKVTGALRAASACAGWAAANAIWTVCEGGALEPALQLQLHDGRRMSVALVGSSFEEAMARLERNEEGASVSALAYEGIIGLPALRTPAIVLEVRHCAPTAVTLRIAVPYRARGEHAGFAVFRPCVLHPEQPGTMALQVIAAGFFEGVDAYQPAGLLDKYLDETS